MKFGKFTGIVLMAISAVGIAAGTANAAPAVTQPAPAVVAHNDATSGVDHGINYKTSVSPVNRAITATVDAGRFVVAADGSSVALKSSTGATLDQISLHGNLGGHAFSAAQRISADGHTLTLTPQVAAAEIGQVKDVNAINNLIPILMKNALGIWLGGAIGGTLGALLGFGIFSIITAPVGAIIGAGIGGYAMGGQEFLNAVKAAAGIR
ncbi:hypothetical protein [Nocardia macrotermitis]|uniref:DUF8020 domain-containing protein n=1 Tax=Nocardia macrotermitis TaxID=2585198 RepID=A0A7K0CXD6_9NOCA|nr:hypothetical protein [Nocardia macrotermitis]MQY18167.1 hypothetical protein [Nocardia macrotermitis]